MTRSNFTPPVTPIVMRAKGVALDVQGSHADALKGIPCPRSVSLEGGVYKDLGELPKVPPSIGYQCSPYGHDESTD